MKWIKKIKSWFWGKRYRNWRENVPSENNEGIYISRLKTKAYVVWVMDKMNVDLMIRAPQVQAILPHLSVSTISGAPPWTPNLKRASTSFPPPSLKGLAVPRDREELGDFMRRCFFQRLILQRVSEPLQAGSLCQTGQMIFHICSIDGYLVRAGDWLSKSPLIFPEKRAHPWLDSIPKDALFGPCLILSGFHGAPQGVQGFQEASLLPS